MARRVQEAARWRLSREEGAVRKDWGGRIPIALVYPNRYSVGMANLGFLTVYEILNRHGDVVCERAFLPDEEERLELDRTRAAFSSLETQKPLAAFDIIAFSLSYENDYVNVAAILALAGIPVRRKDRAESHPLILAGGPAAFLNPEPMAEIVDVFVLGEAEEALEELLGLYRRRRAGDRRELLEELLGLEGVYVPAFYRPQYHEDGTLAAFEPLGGAPPKVKRRWVRDLDRFSTVASILTPETEFSGIYLVEVGRGCRRNCPFCSTGQIYRPLRYRSLEALKPALHHGIRKGLRLGLVTASAGDYPELDALCQWLLENGGSLAAPSLRLDTLSDRLLEALRASGQKTVTLAPEAGTERLRKVVHKLFSDEEILESVDRLAAHGIFGLRLYFMVGLPGEEKADVDAIVDLAKRIRHRYLRAAKQTGRMAEITLSVNPFVPKPWTPFQWCAMEEEGTLKERLNRVRRPLQKEPNITVTAGLAKWAYLEGLFSRGDRRVCNFVTAGLAPGKSRKKALSTSSLNPDFYVCRPRPREERFPWDFIDNGFSKEALYREYERRVPQA
ncbi:MAG: radical SAM protein [bacterium]